MGFEDLLVRPEVEQEGRDGTREVADSVFMSRNKQRRQVQLSQREL